MQLSEFFYALRYTTNHQVTFASEGFTVCGIYYLVVTVVLVPVPLCAALAHYSLTHLRALLGQPLYLLLLTCREHAVARTF